jgi:hypothetical protein
LEYFADSSCRASLDESVVTTPEWNFTGWLGWLNGSCPSALDGFSKLDGLSLENRATILSTLPSCADEQPDTVDGRSTALLISTTILASSSLASNSTTYPSGLRGGVAQIVNSGTVPYFLSNLALAVVMYASVSPGN